MRHLFLKIFLWFWATVVVTGISLVLIWVFQPSNASAPWHSGFEDTLRYFGTAAVDLVERNGVGAASDYIHGLSKEAHVRTCLFDQAGHPLTDEDCSGFNAIVGRIARGESPGSATEHGFRRMAVSIKGADGRTFIYASEVPAGARAAPSSHSGGAPLRIAVALLVSGLICYGMTLYLVTPILRLSSAAQQIAAGDLSIRAEPRMELRRDELGDLVRDFNRMADKTEQVVSSQRQLLYDVSHELRSPLARMNVALDLLRVRIGDDPKLDRLGIDLQRLNNLIGRLLTVAKLEATATLSTAVPVSLSELITSVVNDANFEAQESGTRVVFEQAPDVTIQGDSNLLRSAVENVLRNAVRFTRPGTSVEVALRTNGESAIINIRDHGSGVPDVELANIFKPFYRVTDLQSRDSKGVGLGLAIAERVVRLHGGSVHAINEAYGGLRVEMTLPL
jgi:two-component system sensor histidine kinase CpxA